jgi:hypothetical protein
MKTLHENYMKNEGFHAAEKVFGSGTEDVRSVINFIKLRFQICQTFIA